MLIFTLFSTIHLIDSSIFTIIDSSILTIRKSSDIRSVQNKLFYNLKHTNLQPIRLTNTSAIFLHIPTNQVIKHYKLDCTNNINMDEPYKEHKICLQLDHPNVLKTYSLHKIMNKNSCSYFLICEYLNIKITHSYVNKDENVIKNVCKDVLNGLKYLHKLGYAHLDLKIDNIMGTVINNKIVYKIIDFGFTRKVNDKNLLLINEYYGTFPYAPPEIYYDGIYSKKADVWCLGIMVFIMMKDKNYFYRKDGERHVGRYHLVLKNGVKNMDCGSKELKRFVERCVKVDYQDRPTVGELLDDRFLKEVDHIE